MGRKLTITGITAREYLSKFPDSPTRTLSRKMLKENPEVFNSFDHAKSVLTYHRGLHGKQNLRQLKDRTHVKQPKNYNEGGIRKIPELPEGETTLDWKVFKIFGNHKTLVISDIHVPYHSKSAIELAIQKAKTFEIDQVILNGDILDHYSLSRWNKDPRKRDFKKEREISLVFLEYIRSHFPNSRIIFKEGNHEERYTVYMELQAPDLLGIPEFTFENVFKLDDFGIEFVKEKNPIKLNELFILHGHEYKFAISNPVNPARGIFLRTKTNTLIGHLHQPSSHSERTLGEKEIGCWSTGHLSEPHPRYMPLNKWSHGLCVVETHGNKNFQVNNYKIIDNEVFRV